MSRETKTRARMFTDHADIGIVISGLRRYNLFTAAFFLGRHHRLIAELARLSGAGTGDQALDIGCGPGKLVRALGDMVGPEGGVVGVDPSETAVAYNRRRDRSPNHRYEQSVAQQLNQLDAAFDIITCTFVMHHIPEQHRVAAVEEMWRVLRPGGRLLLADAHPTVRARSVFAGIARLARRGSNPHDTFDAVDIRQYSETLVAVGFATPHFVTSRYSTGILIAEKPDLP